MVKKQLNPASRTDKLRKYIKTYQPQLVGFLLSIIAILLTVTLILLVKLPERNEINNQQNHPDIIVEKSDSLDNLDNIELVEDDFIASDDVVINFATRFINHQSHPVIAMIDNHFEAWDSQFGLGSAQIVYHTLVEGGTTRFMAVFDTYNTDTRIGPVRSVRPYFIPWVLEYDALLAYVGGSPEALQDIVDLDVNNLNEMTSYGPLYFDRDNEYIAPHSTFVSTDKLNEALKKFNLTNPNQLPLSHFTYVNKLNSINVAGKDSVLAHDNKFYQNQTITIDYSAKKTYDIEYRWNNTYQGYVRYRFGELQRDAETDGVILINNIIIQRVPTEEVLDSKLRIAMDVTGEGEAIIFKNGQAIDATWEKKSIYSPTIFYDLNGEEIKFNPGNVWVEIVPDGHDVEF